MSSPVLENVRLLGQRRRPSSVWRWLLLVLPALGSLFFAVNPLDLPRWLRPLLDLSHVPIFALASALLVRWVAALARLSARRQLLAALAGSLLIGGGIEIIQPWFGRNCAVGDAISDMAGAAAGVLFCSRRRREFSWHWRRALQLSILAVVLLAGHRAVGWYLASSEAFARFPLVADFEAPYADRLWSSGTRTDAIARGGLHSLHLTFDPSGWAATTYEPPVADWSGFRTLQMAVFNPAQQAQRFSILIADRSVPDRSGNQRPWFRQGTELRPGWNHLEVAMEDVAAGGARGPIDIANIGFLTLEIPQPAGVVELFIDDVLLVPAPAGETDVAERTATAESLPR